MIAFKTDALRDAEQKLQKALAAEIRDHDEQWINGVHDALGALTHAIQTAIHIEEQVPEHVGAINPDFQNAPVNDRHVDEARARLINLGEQAYALRADIRQEQNHLALDLIQVRLRGQDIASALEKLHHDEDSYILDTINSNPGAGE